MPNLLASITSTTAQSAPATYADVTDLSATVTVASTSSIILIIAAVPVVLDATDRTADFQFADGGAREGPEMTLVFSDQVNEGAGGCMVYAKTGVSGSRTFSLQWQDRTGTPALDTGRNRSFQVVELLSGEADLLVNVTSTTAGAAPVSYADIPDFSGVATVDSTDSIVLFLANVTTTVGVDAQTDETADMQFADNGTREGPEVTFCWVDAADDLHCGVMAYAKTGISGSHTFSCQWQRRDQISDLDTARTRSFQVLDLKAANLLVGASSTTSDTAPATYADIANMSGTAIVGSTSNVVLFFANIPIVLDATDRTADMQFADGGIREGPEITFCYSDNVNEGMSSGLVYAKDGISGSRTFSVQWQDRLSTPSTDTGRTRTFQVIELTSAVSAIPAMMYNYRKRRVP